MQEVSAEGIKVTRYALLSKEKSKNFLEETIVLQPEEYMQLCDEISVLTVVENSMEELCCKDLFGIKYTKEQINKIL